MTILRAAALMPLLMAAPLVAQMSPTTPKPIGMTLQQFQAVGRDRLFERDADGDGKISKSEFMTPAPGKKARAAKPTASGTDDAASPAGKGMMAGRMGDRVFQRFDANGDGYLNKSEIDAMLAKRFERMDANHDGILTADERKASRGGMHGQMSPEQ